MLIALDYDGTYTRDHCLWDRFIELSRGHGHEIVCVTMRYAHEPVMMPCEVIYTGRKAKAAFMQEAGRTPDIWIDDKPHWLFQDG